jgi:dTDP-4-dehydrorhamnose 3,5-epimerase-like enzyme
MSKRQKDLWIGLNESARKAMTDRNYKEGSFAQRVARGGVDAAELAAADRRKADIKKIWIPGVEIFSREIHSQRHRGLFGEFVRKEEGILGKIALWPQQWSAARMFAHSVKGFHIHPPSVPSETTAEKWLRRLFIDEAENYALRQYTREQWDVMFFVQGRAEMILRDVRAGLPSRTMHFFVDGDNHRSSNNVGVIIPPGVAHAIRAEGSDDLIMVYGTSTSFYPEFEGRIASEIETAELPESWRKFLGESGNQESRK